MRPGQNGDFRRWIRLVLVYFLIPSLLLICGGDPVWWQAWFFALLFIGIGIGGRIWAEVRHPGLTAERQSSENLRNAKAWDKILAPLMAMSISFPVVIVAGFDHRFDWSGNFDFPLNIAGFVLIAIGYAFAAWAMAENRFFYSLVLIQTDKGHVVCNTGPYRYVRHPGYAGSIVPLFGIVLALESLWTLIPVAVALAICVFRTVLEDQTLHEEMPGYREYADRVRYRLMPGIF